jgi:MoaA/NifB/PqqE/SkfB family radical SAM enzyme
MGCLNSTANFDHWFGNIHLSGPCNRSCYFCIGQHMMALDPLNNLDSWPLPGMDEFLQKCLAKNIKEVNITGSNTDPLLAGNLEKIVSLLREKIPGVRVGLRTNGVLAVSRPHLWRLFDKASVSITSFDPAIYKATMGQGTPPDLAAILKIKPEMPVKVNVVLCPEILTKTNRLHGRDLDATLWKLMQHGVLNVNLREPYGQPHLGDPLAETEEATPYEVYGMVQYDGFGKTKVTYWDVHYCEVESVNLYANGIVSDTYPVSKGHHPVTGDVRGQENFETSGRIRPQWVTVGAS